MLPLILQTKVIYYQLTKRPVFIIAVQNGSVSIEKGSPKKSFLADCREVLQLHAIKNGIVYAAPGQYGKTMLYASSEISQAALQQLRNAWSFS